MKPTPLSNDDNRGLDITETSLPARSTTREASEFWRDPLAYRQVAVGIQHVEGQRLLSLHTFDPATLIIDLGTGDGSLAFDHLLPLIPQGLLVGVDKSEEMLDGAARYVDGKPGAERVSFMYGDVTDADGEWLSTLRRVVQSEKRPVVVFTSAMLHHIHNLDQFRLALRTIRSLLQEAPSEQPTRFLASFAGEGNFDLLIACCDDVRNQTEWAPFFAEWGGYPLLRPSAERMSLELLEAGFDLSDAKVDLACLELLLDSNEQLFRFVRGCMRSFMSHLQQAIHAKGVSPDEEKGLLDSFAQQVTDQYLARCHRSPSGEIIFPVSNIEISVAPAAGFRVADFIDGKAAGDARELASIEFLEMVNQLPEVQAYKPVVQEQLAVQPGQTVLDAGCGTGADGVWLLDALQGGGKLLAIDRNAARVRYASDRFRAEATVEVSQQDLSRLDLSDSCLDRIYSERVLLHASEPLKILEEFQRLLKPGGRVVLVEPDFTRMEHASDDPQLTARIIAARASEIANPNIGECLCDLAAQVGLEVEFSVMQQLHHDYESSKLLDLNDIAGHAGEGLYPTSEEVQNWLIEQARRAAEGTFHATVPMHIVTLTKSA